MVQDCERVSLAQMLAAGVDIGWEEAVAIVRELCTPPPSDGVPVTSRPLTPGKVWLDCEGTLTVSPGVPMTAAHAGDLLEVLLLGTGRPRQGRLPGALLLLLARALGQIDAPGFPTPSAFAESLARFERTPRRELLRSVFAKWIAVQTLAAPRDDMIAATPVVAAQNESIDLRARESFPPASQSVLVVPTLRPRRRPLRTAAFAAIAAASMAAGSAAAWMMFRDTAPPVDRAVTGSRVPSEAATADRDTAPPPPAAAPDRSPPPPPAVREEVVVRPKPLVRSAQRHDEPRPLLDPTAIEANAAFSPSFAANGTAVFFHAQRPDGSALKRAEKDDADHVLHVATIVDDGAKNYHIQVSPAGDAVAFDSDRDGERAVYTARADGGGVRRVSGDGYSSVPKWSPDGRQLIFARAEADRPRVWNLWAVDLRSGLQRRLSSHPFGQTWPGAWFGDGRRVCYSHEDRLVVLDLATGRRQIYESPVRGRLVRTPAVSPNGRWVMFQVFRDGGWLLDLVDGSMQRVLDDSSAEEFTWSPDGRRVAFHSRRSGAWGLWVMSPR